jgi:2-succinyl-5-enolpyruvyl-6-hydroxy-3-cyclohexene-1-carboxylate synthase
MDPALVLTTVDQAVYRACRMPAGPVHLNCMFREPLAPEGDGVGGVRGLERLRPWFESGRPYTAYEQGVPAIDPGRFEAEWEVVRGTARGLVVAGRLRTAADGAAVEDLAEALGWPLLADVGSQVRLGGRGSNQIYCFDHLLASERFRQDHTPEAVFHFGRRSTSKRLMAFLDHHRPGHYLVVDDHPSRFDPAHQVTARAEADVQAYCNGFLAAMGGAARELKRSSWLQEWHEAGSRAAAALGDFFSAAEGLSEPLVARSVSALIPEHHGLVLAASMPVRDMDMYAVHDGARVHVASNRGASGIDGTVATAAGYAHGRQKPVTLVTGDLALLHDLNGLAVLRGMPVVVVVLNNDGGGIFSFLPISRHHDVFERYFGTPHGLGFEAAARMFGLDYAHPDTPGGFRTAYREACASGRATLIEVTTDRAANEELHRKLLGVVTDLL